MSIHHRDVMLTILVFLKFLCTMVMPDVTLYQYQHMWIIESHDKTLLNCIAQSVVVMEFEGAAHNLRNKHSGRLILHMPRECFVYTNDPDT